MRAHGGTPLRAALARAAGLTAVVALLAPAAAAAETLSSGDAVKRECAARALPPGTAGVASSAWSAPAEGLLSARLDAGPAPDWDLALLRNGEPAGASTSFGSIEQATIAVRAGDQVVAQACRRDRIGRGGGARSSTCSRPPGSIHPPDAPRWNRWRSRAPMTSRAWSSSASTSPTTSRRGPRPWRSTTTGSGRCSRAPASRPTTLIEDLAAEDRADRRAESRAAVAPRVSPLPTGREAYRVYEDYTTELKDARRGQPRVWCGPVTLGTLLRGPADRGDRDRGRRQPRRTTAGPSTSTSAPTTPASGRRREFPMEFAHTLVQGFNASDARIVDLLDDVRVVIVPVVNPTASSPRAASAPARSTTTPTRPCPRRSPTRPPTSARTAARPTPAQASLPCALRTGSGVDLNRNYGYYWGGPGSSTDTTTQSYRGTGPFSEPESQAVHAVQLGRPPHRLHHQPHLHRHRLVAAPARLRRRLPAAGRRAAPITPDEPAMKALGDAMGDAGATGWTVRSLGPGLGARRHHRRDRGLELLRPGHLRLHARGARARTSTPTTRTWSSTEYVGDASHPGEGVREAFLLAGEEAAEHRQPRRPRRARCRRGRR